MRLWTLHPKYLDAAGLVAVWREALLAKAVLSGRTRGYTHHPQLARFRRVSTPLVSISCYLAAVHEEATRRGYGFDRRKIGRLGRVRPIPVTSGQLAYEWRHLKRKLAARSRPSSAGLPRVLLPDAHPLFRVVQGGVESWEVAAGRRRALRGGGAAAPTGPHRPRLKRRAPSGAK